MGETVGAVVGDAVRDAVGAGVGLGESFAALGASRRLKDPFFGVFLASTTKPPSAAKRIPKAKRKATGRIPVRRK